MIYDFVVIGSGISGLVSAAILSKQGHRVVVLEKQPILGGCMQVFVRDKTLFDTGIHYVGSLGKNELLYQLFKYLNIMDELDIEPMDPAGFDTILLQGDEVHYKYANGYEGFKKQMLLHFPEQENSIQAYVDKVKKINSNFPIHNFSPSQKSIDPKLLTTSVGEFMNSITSNQKLKHVLTGTNYLYGGKEYETPFYVHALSVGSYIQSSWRFVHGSQQVVQALRRQIVKRGGEIKKRHEVSQLRSQDDINITDAICTTGERIKGRNFISTIHPSITVKMVQKGLLRPSYVQRIQEISNTSSSFCVYIKFKPNQFKYKKTNYYFLKRGFEWIDENYTQEDWPINFYFLTPPTAHNMEFAKTAHLMCYMNFSEVAKWKNSETGARPPQYYAFVNEKAEALIDTASKYFPDLKESIESYYTSSPLTYRDYTGTIQGSTYGLMKNSKDMLRTFISHKTKVPNLWLAGQSILVNGMIGSAMSAVVACGSSIGLSKLLEEIRKA